MHIMDLKMSNLNQKYLLKLSRYEIIVTLFITNIIYYLTH